MADRRLNTVVSTSAGRLFDAASAICGICRQSTFEGEASMSLEFAAERFEKTADNHIWNMSAEDHPVRDEGRLILPTEKLIRDLTRMRLDGENADRLAWLFHRRLADQIISAVLAIRKESGTETAALSGGCFQNRLLLSFVEKGLAEAGMKVLIHHLVPPNDGGIALGQAVAARQALQDGLIPQT
jgi:hydrogenase maturation protein HypF